MDQTRRVLIADDEATSRALLERTLAERGWEVAVARDGSEAWAVLAGPRAPRLAVLDWMMPGHDGVELVRMLAARKAAPLVYTILLTVKDAKQDLIEGLQAGACDFLKKPFDPDELAGRLAVGARLVAAESALEEQSEQLRRFGSQMEALAEKRARQLLHAERLASVGAMAGGIAHEINNPAAYIGGNAEMLEKFWALMQPLVRAGAAGRTGREAEDLALALEQTPRLLATIREGVRRIGRILEGLKLYSRQTKGERVRCRLSDLVRRALELTHNALKYHVTVEERLDPGLPDVLGDPQQLEQVFVNLFLNAAEATRPAGQGKLSVETSRAGAAVRVTVSDDGPGIPPAIADRIWQPFFTTKEGEGTGLGLAIVCGIVESHGGWIAAENLASGGARFTFELPLGPPP